MANFPATNDGEMSAANEGQCAAKLKARETCLRKAADRYGLRLIKSRSCNPEALDFGLYALIDVRYGGAVNPSLAGRWTCSWTLEEVDAWLKE